MSKKIISIAILTILCSGALALTARAQNVQDAVTGLDQTVASVTAFKSQTGGNNNTYNTAYIAGRAGQIVGIILSFVGVIFLGLMIYAGIMWMTAQGNEQQVTKAKDLIINSVVGVIIVFAAYALTVFIGQNFLQ